MSGIPVSIFGRLFPSEKKAAAAVGVTRKTIRRRLEDPDFHEIRYHDGKQEEEQRVSNRKFREKVKIFRESMLRPVSIFGKVFRTANRASVESGIPDTTIRKRLRSPKFPEFRYCEVMQKSTVSDLQFRKKIENFREHRHRCVSVFGMVFSTARSAAREIGMPSETLRNRLKDPRVPEVHYLDGRLDVKDDTIDPETRKRIKALLYKPPRPVSVLGKTYSSANKASKATGIPSSTVANRLASEKFPEYYYVDKPAQSSG